MEEDGEEAVKNCNKDQTADNRGGGGASHGVGRASGLQPLGAAYQSTSRPKTAALKSPSRTLLSVVALMMRFQ